MVTPVDDTKQIVFGVYTNIFDLQVYSIHVYYILLHNMVNTFTKKTLNMMCKHLSIFWYDPNKKFRADYSHS